MTMRLSLAELFRKYRWYLAYPAGLVIFLALVVLLSPGTKVPDDIFAAAQQRLTARTQAGLPAVSGDTTRAKVNATDGAIMVFCPSPEEMSGSHVRHGAYLFGPADDGPWVEELVPEERRSDQYGGLHGTLRKMALVSLQREDPGISREVELAPFWLYQHEVANWQYALFVHATKKHPLPKMTLQTLEFPVEVTWEEASDYCQWARGVLPSEMEWEWAARGPSGYRYPWGDDWVEGMCAYGELKPVGSYPTGNSWCGASDMAGNVSEWCRDYYHPRYYAESPSRLVDPDGPEQSIAIRHKVGPEVYEFTDVRAVRGGTHSDFDRRALAASSRNADGRLSGRAGPMKNFIEDARHGFRCAFR